MLQSSGRVDNLSLFVFGVYFHPLVHMASMEWRREMRMSEGSDCSTEAEKGSLREDRVPESRQSSMGRFEESNENEVTTVALPDPQLKTDYHVRLDLDSISVIQAGVGDLRVERFLLAGELRLKYGRDCGQKFLRGNVPTSNVQCQASQSLGASIQDIGSGPLHALPDCPALWKSGQDSMNPDPLSGWGNVWKPIQTEEFRDLWQGCLETDDWKTWDQDRRNRMTGRRNLEKGQDSDSGFGDSGSDPEETAKDCGMYLPESLFEGSLPVATEEVSVVSPPKNSWPVATEKVCGVTPSEDPFPDPTEEDSDLNLSADSSLDSSEEDYGMCLFKNSSPVLTEEDLGICLSPDSSPVPTEEDLGICISPDSSPVPTEEDLGICLSPDSSPVQTEKTCGICRVPFRRSKFDPRRRFGLLNNCEHTFCYPCLRGFCKPIFEPFFKSAFCPECGIKSDAVATSVFWMEGVEKRAFFNDFLFEALISPKRSPLVTCTGVRFRNQNEEDEAVIRFVHY